LTRGQVWSKVWSKTLVLDFGLSQTWPHTMCWWQWWQWWGDV